MIHLEFDRDKLGEELTTTDISRRELEQDKMLIKLINTACKDDKASRVIEWVNRLNHVQSFDGAIKIADFYRLVGLKEKIEMRKEERLGEDPLEKARDRRKELAALLTPRPAPRTYFVNQPAHPNLDRPRLLEDFRPPPTIHRPGLAPAIPVIETTRYSTTNLPSRATSAGSSTTLESKRKRDGEQSDSASKRRALESATVGPPPPKPKPSAFVVHIFGYIFTHTFMTAS
jgi:chromosome transmission fidelity protein 4